MKKLWNKKFRLVTLLPKLSLAELKLNPTVVEVCYLNPLPPFLPLQGITHEMLRNQISANFVNSSDQISLRNDSIHDIMIIYIVLCVCCLLT